MQHGTRVLVLALFLTPHLALPGHKAQHYISSVEHARTYQAFYQAVTYGDITGTIQHLQKGCDPNHYFGLTHAPDNTYVPDQLQEVDASSWGKTALHIIDPQNHKLAKKLLTYGADPNAPALTWKADEHGTIETDKQTTPLISACYNLPKTPEAWENARPFFHALVAHGGTLDSRDTIKHTKRTIAPHFHTCLTPHVCAISGYKKTLQPFNTVAKCTNEELSFLLPHALYHNRRDFLQTLVKSCWNAKNQERRKRAQQARAYLFITPKQETDEKDWSIATPGEIADVEQGVTALNELCTKENYPQLKKEILSLLQKSAKIG